MLYSGRSVSSCESQSGCNGEHCIGHSVGRHVEAIFVKDINESCTKVYLLKTALKTGTLNYGSGATVQYSKVPHKFRKKA